MLLNILQMQRTASATKNYLAQVFKSAKVEKQCINSLKVQQVFIEYC